MNRLSKRLMASPRLLCQIMGAILKEWWLLLLLILVILSFWRPFFTKSIGASWLQLGALTLLAWYVISVCRTLTDIFNLRKKESGITWCQIAILMAIGIWIIGVLLIFDIKSDGRYFLALSIVGSMVAFVFQDALKGVVAFIHLRLNHLLCIDDWIVVPQYNVDGEVKRVTLTTVTVYNWDTTTSSFPISALLSGHFKNLQNMTTGKTYGRQIKKTFIFDTSCIHPLSASEAEQLQTKTDILRYVPKEEIKEGDLNAHIYRLYLMHWLMNHPKISQSPALVIRWMEHCENGMPLQMYAFIMEGGFSAFEWQQSLIIEHIIASSEWFGMKLFQTPSANDVSNSVAHFTNKSATYSNKETRYE